jgi:hypothetical protein
MIRIVYIGLLLGRWPGGMTRRPRRLTSLGKRPGGGGERHHHTVGGQAGRRADGQTGGRADDRRGERSGRLSEFVILSEAKEPCLG